MNDFAFLLFKTQKYSIFNPPYFPKRTLKFFLNSISACSDPHIREYLSTWCLLCWTGYNWFMGHLVTTTSTVHLISVDASQEDFFSQIKIMTNFLLKITSQNIVWKEHEQVYYAYLINTGTALYFEMFQTLYQNFG